MMQQFVRVAILAGLTTSGMASGAFNLEYEHVPGQLIVKFKDGAKSARATRLVSELQGVARHVFNANGAVSLQFPRVRSEAELEKVARVLAQDPAVAYVEANTIMHAYVDRALPNDPRFGELYGLHNDGSNGGKVGADIHAPEAWALTTGSSSVLVGVIDTGVDYSHPEIAPNYWTNPGESGLDSQGRDMKSNGVDDDANGFVDDWRGWDFVNNDNDPMDDHSHGTHVSGTIGAAGDNGLGVVGVNWRVSLVGLKFLSGAGSGTLEDAVEAIEYANKLNVVLTSNSWGGGGFSDTMVAAIEAAAANGILFVAAAGNDAADNDAVPHYPSGYDMDNIIAVAALDRTDSMASFSCYGKKTVDVGAPGVDILSSVPNGGYTTMSGTSMATPHVSGVAALVKAMFPDAAGPAIKNRVVSTVDPIPALAGKTVSGGRVNAASALEIDTIPPGAVSNVAVTSQATTGVGLSWGAAGDDGDSGAARGYLVRWSVAPILTDADWDQATTPNVTVDAADGQGVVRATVGSLAFNTQGHLAVRAVDNVGNVGSLSGSTPFSVRQVQKVGENAGDTMNGVTADAPWGVETISGGNAFSDSPTGAYNSNANVSLTLPVLSVTSPEVAMTVRSSYVTEEGYDLCRVEVSKDNGVTWREIDRASGDSHGYVEKTYDLSTVLAGATAVQVRFRLTTDYSITGDGWKIDHVAFFAPMRD